MSGRKYLVCYCRNYATTYQTVALHSLLTDITNCCGKEKYGMVCSLVSPWLTQLDNMLLMDYIINNTDRHLNNIEMYVDTGSNLVGLVDMYDSGAALFSNLTVKEMELALRETYKYSECKPFYTTFGEQVKLLTHYNLHKVSLSDVYRLVNKYFEGERARLLCKFLKVRLTELDLVER